MIGEYVRFNREARALLGLRRRRHVARRLARASCATRASFVDRLIVPQACRGVVGGPGADVVVPRALPRRVLPQPRDARRCATGRSGARSRGGSARYVEALTRPFGDRIRLSTPVQSIAPPRRPRAGHARAAASPSASTRWCSRRTADQALRCSPTRPTASARSSARSPTSPTRPCCTPTARCCRAGARAWASWNYHLLDEPTGSSTVTYHMNRLQRLTSRRELCVTLNRTEAIDPDAGDRDDPVLAPGLHRPRAGGPGAPRRDLRRRRTHYCGAYWRWGFHEDGVVSALRVGGRGFGSDAPAASTRAGSATAAHEPVQHGFAIRSPAVPRPRRAARGARRAIRCGRRAARRSARFRRARLPRRPGGPARRRSRPWTDRAGRPGAPAHPRCARSGIASTRSASTTASTRRRARRSGRRRGHEHALGRAPHLRAAARRRRARHAGRLRQGVPRLAVHGHGPPLRVARRRAGRRAASCTSNRCARAPVVRRDADAQPPRARPADAQPPAVRYPAATLVAGAGSTLQALRLKLKGAPLLPASGARRVIARAIVTRPAARGSTAAG